MTVMKHQLIVMIIVLASNECNGSNIWQCWSFQSHSRLTRVTSLPGFRDSEEGPMSRRAVGRGFRGFRGFHWHLFESFGEKIKKDMERHGKTQLFSSKFGRAED